MQPTRPMPALDPDLAQAPPLPAEDGTRDTLRTVMPWVLSFLGHLAVMILAALAVGVAVKQLTPTPPLPIADLTTNPEVPNQMTTGPVAMEQGGPSGQGQLAEIDPATLPAPPQPTVQPLPRGPSQLTGKLAAFQAAPMASSASSGGGKSNIFEMGDGSNRPGHGGQDGTGIGQPIRKIVFLVDASGSLVDTLPFVIDELRRTLDTRLEGDKQFNIIFFSGKSMNKSAGSVGGLTALFPSRLEPASVTNRKKASDWIQQVEAGGSGDALAAIKKALEMDPDQIHLLSDNITGSGVWEMHQDRFIAEMKAAYDKSVARRHGLRVDFKTYQFVYADPLEKIGREPTLRRLVEETGGLAADYKFITARSLGLR